MTSRRTEHVEGRAVEARDETRLHSFFQAIPLEDRAFLKDDVDDPSMLRRWIDDDRSIRLIAVDTRGDVAAVWRLVLAATLPGWGGVPGHLTALLSMGTPLRYYSRTFYERSAGTVAGGRARYDEEHVRRLWRDRAGHAPSFTGYSQQLWAMSLWSSLPWLTRVTAPTLIVVGDDDPLVPLSNPLMMAARMPNARVFVSAREGHFLLLDKDSSALPAIHDFFAAEDLADAEVWRSALRVERDQVDRQMRADGLGALPWGVVSAVVRRVFA
jgi:pimeloyl-ACP methyl ester carboxylesterase